MSSGTYGALLVFGSGPGIGRNVAALFAQRGFSKVVLLSRNTERLQEDAKFVKAAKAGADVETVSVDLSKTEIVRAALEEVNSKLKGSSIDAVLYNAARVGQSKFFDFSPEDFEADLRISILSLYTVAQWALPKMASGSGTPAFLVTSGLLYKDPAPPMFSLASGKAGQYNLVHSLHKEFEPKGVHVASIVVGGRVADESELTNARNIAKEAWKLFSQPKGKGESDVVILDPAYAEHVKRREQEDRK